MRKQNFLPKERLQGQTASLGNPENGSRSTPLKTAKRSGTARAKCPKTHQKRSRLRTENGASESGKNPKAFGEALAQPQNIYMIY